MNDTITTMDIVDFLETFGGFTTNERKLLIKNIEDNEDLEVLFAYAETLGLDISNEVSNYVLTLKGYEV